MAHRPSGLNHSANSSHKLLAFLDGDHTLAARGCVTYRKERVRNYRDYLTIDKKYAYLSWLYQCNRGVLMAPGAEENWTLSVQHSEDDVLRYVRNFEEMAKDLTG